MYYFDIIITLYYYNELCVCGVCGTALIGTLSLSTNFLQ